MQRLLCRKHASSTLSTNNAFSSLSKQTFHNPYQRYIFNSSKSTPFHHFHSNGSYHFFSPNTLRGFFSKSLFSKYFMSNSQLRVSSRGLGETKISNLRVLFCRGSSGFTNTSFGSYGRSWRLWLNRLSANDMVLGLIIANVSVFLLGRVAVEIFMEDNFMISLDNVKEGRVHTLITSAFTHYYLDHIIPNMIPLHYFGPSIGRTFGPEFILKLYLAGAIGGSVFYLVHKMGQEMYGGEPSTTLGLGSDGAVNAFMVLDIFLHPRATLLLLGVFLVGRDLLRIIEGDSNTSGSTNLGGSAVAALAFARVRKGRF